MTSVNIIQNIEIECSNSQQLGDAFEKRLLTLRAGNVAIIAQLQEQNDQIDKAIVAIKDEIAVRIEAMQNIIGEAA